MPWCVHGKLGIWPVGTWEHAKEQYWQYMWPPGNRVA